MRIWVYIDAFFRRLNSKHQEVARALGVYRLIRGDKKSNPSLKKGKVYFIKIENYQCRSVCVISTHLTRERLGKTDHLTATTLLSLQ